MRGKKEEEKFWKKKKKNLKISEKYFFLLFLTSFWVEKFKVEKLKANWSEKLIFVELIKKKKFFDSESDSAKLKKELSEAKKIKKRNKN